jgi:hypothetical protein
MFEVFLTFYVLLGFGHSTRIMKKLTGCQFRDAII